MTTAPTDEAPAWLLPAPPTKWRRLTNRLNARGQHRHAPSVLEIISELLLASGITIALFTGWMLVWTDITANATHERIVAELPWSTTPGDSAPLPPASAPDPSAELLKQGTTIAVLRVPRFGEDYLQPISEGVDKATVLDVLGIGHYPGTALPGQVGNFAVAAHRATFGKPFNRIAELIPGDQLIIDTPDGRFTYAVTSSEIVSPSDTSVIAPEPEEAGAEPTNRWITLTSCHPMFSARQRYVVHGVLESWTPKSSEGTA